MKRALLFHTQDLIKLRNKVVAEHFYFTNCITDTGAGRELNARTKRPASQPPERGRPLST